MLQHDPPPPSCTLTKSRAGPILQYRVPHGYEWNQYDLSIPNLAPTLAGLKILHISDLHFKAFWSPVYDEMIGQINAASADLILFTGDFNDRISDCREAVPFIRKFLTPLRAKLGKFGVYGNHDPTLAGVDLRDTGLTIIERRRLKLEHNNARIELVGLPGLDRIYLDRSFLKSIPPKPQNSLRIILSHYPDQIRRAEFLDPDLYFAGHTHGGQICLPTGSKGYPLLRHDSLPRHLCHGIHRYHDSWLIVSKGLGYTSLPIRLFCSTEIIQLNLSSA